MTRRSRYTDGPFVTAAGLLGTAAVMGGTGCALKWAGLTWFCLGRLPYWAVVAVPFGAMGVLFAWAVLAASTERTEEQK